MRALIDTCIIIDALQNREGFCDDAQRIFLAVANKRFASFLSATSQLFAGRAENSGFSGGTLEDLLLIYYFSKKSFDTI